MKIKWICAWGIVLVGCVCDCATQVYNKNMLNCTWLQRASSLADDASSICISHHSHHQLTCNWKSLATLWSVITNETAQKIWISYFHCLQFNLIQTSNIPSLGFWFGFLFMLCYVHLLLVYPMSDIWYYWTKWLGMKKSDCTSMKYLECVFMYMMFSYLGPMPYPPDRL